jgi:hypothetical protein
MYSLFVELLQISVGTRDSLSRVPSALEWERIFDEAKRQAVAGIMLTGMERMPDKQRPNKVLLLQWIGICQQIETQNSITTKTCIKVSQRLDNDGFNACVLKGQSNYRYYPAEMKNRRSCGDVDVWVVPKEECKNHVRQVVEHVDANYNMDLLCWLHNGFTDDSGVPVEVHFRPSFMSEPCRNRRFQKYFRNILSCRTITELDGVEIPCMKVDEDVIYQMNHIYRHLIDEGVGLRQVVDYYFMLTAWNKQHTRTKEDTMKIVSWLGMKRFAGALMYVLREMLGMPEEYLLCPASVKDGEFLMNEIVMSGNFGHNDPRMGAVSTSGGYIGRRLSQACRRFKRNMRFLTSYPGEVIWEPIVRVEHFVWKKLKLWRF